MLLCYLCFHFLLWGVSNGPFLVNPGQGVLGSFSPHLAARAESGSKGYRSPESALLRLCTNAHFLPCCRQLTSDLKMLPYPLFPTALVYTLGLSAQPYMRLKVLRFHTFVFRVHYFFRTLSLESKYLLLMCKHNFQRNFHTQCKSSILTCGTLRHTKKPVSDDERFFQFLANFSLLYIVLTFSYILAPSLCSEVFKIFTTKLKTVRCMSRNNYTAGCSRIFFLIYESV